MSAVSATVASSWPPDYSAIYADRARRLAWIRAHSGAVPALREFYAKHPADFIDQWGCTYDPRNPERGLPSTVPFVLFPRQRELIAWLLERWLQQERGLVEKSRDTGASWVLMAFVSTMCLFHRGLTFGIGSRKEELLDQTGNLSALFPKARMFLQALPPEFLQGWSLQNSADRRITFPATGSAIIGEAGDQIGRGARASMYLIDEAAFLERPALIDASLSATSNCRIDVSTPNGRGNPFATKRFAGKIPVFTLHWRSRPDRNDVWYAKQCAQLDERTVARELDLNYADSADSVLIPSAWLQSSIDAHITLGIDPTGWRHAALDIGDQGPDENCLVGRHGILIEHCQTWPGRGSDVYATVQRAISLCAENGYLTFSFDAVGVGAGALGAARVVNEERAKASYSVIDARPFVGSAGVLSPNSQDVDGRKNVDMFLNRKSQMWWRLRRKFEVTHNAITRGGPFDPDSIISLSRDLPELSDLLGELSQVTWSLNAVGKVVIDKIGEGVKSPNRADALMMSFDPDGTFMQMWSNL